MRRLSPDGVAENTTQDIMPLSAGGVADAASQDAYCGGTAPEGCTIATIFD